MSNMNQTDMSEFFASLDAERRRFVGGLLASYDKEKYLGDGRTYYERCVLAVCVGSLDAGSTVDRIVLDTCDGVLEICNNHWDAVEKIKLKLVVE